MNSKINKSKEEKDKIITLKFNHSNTKIKSKKFGKIELKHISIGDIIFFSELLDKVIDDKEFVVKVLYHQLITKIVLFIEFNEIPNDELIEIARNFVRHEQDIFQYFKKTNDTEFFSNFRGAIKIYDQKRFEWIQSVIEPEIESSLKALENISKNYAGIIKQTNIEKLTKAISKVAEQNTEWFKGIEHISLAIEQFSLNTRFLSEALESQINFWNNWVKQNEVIFNGYKILWQSFQEQYKNKITEKEAIQTLRKYKWFITPSLPINFIYKTVNNGRRKGNQRKSMNKLFVDYFSSNNFRNLENLVNKWEINEIFKPRMKIFRDCVLVMKNAKDKYNPSNVVLPTLIAQIDSVRIEFMNRNKLSFKTNNKEWKEWFKGKTQSQELLDSANDIFLNILFQNAQPGEPLETPFIFNRHKIMHGEYLKYGRIDNTIRAFLILDFLENLINKSANHEISQEEN
jgi:hypothetical protein